MCLRKSTVSKLEASEIRHEMRSVLTLPTAANGDKMIHIEEFLAYEV